MNILPYYSQALKKGLEKKQLINPKYSLRAYANYLNVHPSVLSLAMKGKRPLVDRDVKSILEKLKLTSKEEALFKESLKPFLSIIDRIKINRNLQRYVLDDDHHHCIIIEWEYFACLELFHLSDFRVDIESVSNKLKISTQRSEEVLKVLTDKRLILKSEDGSFQKNHAYIRTTEDIPSQSIKASHIRALEMAKEKLADIPVELRDYSSMTLAIDPEKLQEAKVMIREFRQKIISLMSEGKKRDVYRFSIQVYPISSIDEEGSQ